MQIIEFGCRHNDILEGLKPFRLSIDIYSPLHLTSTLKHLTMI